MTTTAMPHWLRGQLIAKGVWNTDGVNRKARLCTHTCGYLVLTGLDADTAAWPAVVDPIPLTPLGEALAILANRHTYDYRPHSRTLDGPRRANRITYAPANNTTETRVLAAHACGQPPLPHFDVDLPTSKELPHDPPF